jgi:hypothetical protein
MKNPYRAEYSINGRVGESSVNEPVTAGEWGSAISGYSERADRTYHVLRVPVRTGSLYPASENEAQPYRDVQLTKRPQAAGCGVVDDGDVAIPRLCSNSQGMFRC